MEYKTQQKFIEDLINIYGDMVYRLALSRTRKKEMAEDVFQEVFLKIAKRMPTFENSAGTFSGAIGGFDGITFAGDTAATLSGAAIDNDDWAFDYTGRTLDAGLAMLTLDGGSLAGDKVAVDLSAAAQVADIRAEASLLFRYCRLP